MPQLNTQLKVVFFGTPQFAAELLKWLIEQGIEVVAVVTKPDRPQGRSDKLVPSEVKQMARQLLPHVALLQPEAASHDDFYQALQALQADLFVVVAYGEIIKQRFLDLPTYGCINVHASLLPKYRGAAPIQRAIIAGDQQSGVTIMQMVRKMDAGDMLATAEVAISIDMTYGALEEALCQAAKQPLLDTLMLYAQGKKPIATPQDESQITFAPKIELEEGEIDWQKAAIDIHNLIRGTNPHPGAWCWVDVKGQRKRLKIWQSHYLGHIVARPGQIVEDGKGQLVVGCGKGALSLLELQLEGKRKMDVKEFLRGISLHSLSFVSKVA